MKRKITLNLSRPLRNNRGVAMLLAIFSLILMISIAVEVSYDSSVEYLVAAQQVNRLKAYYNAKSGVEISLLRILLYKKAMATFGKDLGKNASMLDPIWQFPFAWPPVVPAEASSVDKDQIQTAVKDSTIEGSFVATIASEGSRIDINDLGAFGEEGKKIREATKKQILEIFTGQLEHDEEFRKEYSNFKFDELVNNITDWIDEDAESLNGGDEKGQYPDVRSEFIPPNKPFKTLEELHMVAKMDDKLFALLAPRITVYGVKGINVNYATADVIKSLDSRITDEMIQKIMKRRSTPDEGGLFGSADDFYDFVKNLGVDIKPKGETPAIPILTGTEFNFRITSTGIYANSTREITAITYDFENVKQQYIKFINSSDKKDDGKKEEDKKDDKTQTAAPAAPAIPKGRPAVVYWSEN